MLYGDILADSWLYSISSFENIQWITTQYMPDSVKGRIKWIIDFPWSKLG
jgi:hypothetical protein